VAAFDLDADVTHPADFAIARDGGVASYHDQVLLSTVVEQLATLGYQIVRIDTSRWRDDGDMLDGLARALDFPDYFGRNGDALIDCLGDVAHGDYGWDTTATGLATILDRCGPFTKRRPASAAFLSDVLSASSREGMLFGYRLIWLLDISEGQLPYRA
jgi:hypothetical protein